MSGTTGHKRDSHGHVPLTVSGTDGTHSYRSVPMSRLSAKLAKINCLQELYGFANRRKVLGISDENILPKWTEEERQLILARKYELEKNNVGKKKK